jgi:uncharacterized protein
MSGSQIGGQKASKTNRKIYGEDFYKQIGALGGRRGRTGGFASDKVGEDGLTGRERAAVVGAKGGRIGKRTKKKKVETKADFYTGPMVIDRSTAERSGLL